MASPLDLSSVTDCQKKLVLQYAAETRRFEIERFWQRSLFFWGFIAAAFVAYATVADPSKKLGDFMIPISCFGLVSSVAWTLMNRGSKYWQEAWEKKVEAVEKDVLGTFLFSNKEPLKPGGWWGPSRYSASKLTVALSDFTVIVWAFLTIKALPLGVAPIADPLPYLITVATLAYVGGLLVGGRSGD